MTKEELEAKVAKQKDIIRIANDKICSDVEEYIESLQKSAGTKWKSTSHLVLLKISTLLIIKHIVHSHA